MSHEISLTAAQIRVLELLAAADGDPRTRKDLGASSRTLAFLVEEGLVAQSELTATVIVDENVEQVETYVVYSITLEGQQCLEPEPEEEPAPARTQSETLTRCLVILEDGEFHSFRDLNTSSQNQGRLVDRGLAKMEIRDGVKFFQITDHGRAELDFNRNL